MSNYNKQDYILGAKSYLSKSIVEFLVLLNLIDKIHIFNFIVNAQYLFLTFTKNSQAFTFKYCCYGGPKIYCSPVEVPDPTSGHTNWVETWVMVSKYLVQMIQVGTA